MAFGKDAREFVLKIVADVKDATKGMSDVEDSSKSMKDKLTGVGKAVAGGLAIGAVVSFGKASLDAASDAEQAMNGVKAVFGESASQVEEFSNRAIKSMGISDDAYQQFATTTGGLLKDMGVPLNTTITMTDELAQRGADLAAVYGVDADQAFTAMQKAMGGAYKGLKQLGISLDANEVSAYAVSKGWVDAGGNVTEAGKAMATQQLIMQKSADQAGQFAKHSGDVANQQKILKLEFEETQETIGKKLLPIMSKLLGMFVPLLDFTMKYADAILPVVAAVGALVIGFKAYQVISMAVKAATIAWTAAQWLLNVALNANPIGLIIIAITAVIAAVVLLYTKVGWFRDFVNAAIDGIISAFNWLKSVAGTVWDAIMVGVNAAITAFKWLWDVIMGVIDFFKTWGPLILMLITGPIGIAVAIVVHYWDDIVDAFKKAVGFIADIALTVLDILLTPFRLAWQAIKAVWDFLFPYFEGAFNLLRGSVSKVIDMLSGPFRTAMDIIKSVVSTGLDIIQTSFSTVVGAVKSLFDGMADAVKWSFQTAFNIIKSLWNNTIGGFGFSIPSWVPTIGGKDFKIPKMAQGGIVNRPTIALIGESGPEAVVPLGSSGFGNVVINVYALTANAEVGRRVYEALQEYQRTSGRVA